MSCSLLLCLSKTFGYASRPALNPADRLGFFFYRVLLALSVFSCSLFYIFLFVCHTPFLLAHVCSEIDIWFPLVDQAEVPTAWWDAEADKSLLLGVFKHGT